MLDSQKWHRAFFRTCESEPSAYDARFSPKLAVHVDAVPSAYFGTNFAFR